MANALFQGPVAPGQNQDYFRQTGQLSNPYQGPVAPGQSTAQFRSFGQSLAAPTGSVLGASTGPSGGGGGKSISESQALSMGLDYNNLPGGYTKAQQAVDSGAQNVRNDINSGYNAYFSSLDQMMGGLSGQRDAQNQIIDNSYNQGVNDLNAQRDSSQADLNTQSRKNTESQVKNLGDIADNIRNLLHAGNVMLGAKGAADSSATNQYSYAATKLGSKERANVLSQTRSIENDIADRSAKLNNIVTQETSKLKTSRDNGILGVAQWFQQSQNALIQAKAQGQLERGKDLASLSSQLLQQAQQKLMNIDASYRNSQNQLMTWATSNAQNINQLKQNLASVGQTSYAPVEAGGMNATPNFQNAPTTSAYGGGGGYGGNTLDELLKFPQ